MEKQLLLIIIECLRKSGSSGKTILSVARDTGIPASSVSKCISQYSDLFVFCESGKFVAVNPETVPKNNWRTLVIKAIRQDTQHNIVLGLACSVILISLVFVGFVSVSI